MFQRRRFPVNIILMCVHCCINHCLSSRLNVHTSIFAPEPFGQPSTKRITGQ
jgi:hypothetical protein